MRKKNTISANKKDIRKRVNEGVAYIHASFNNTIITISDRTGLVLAWPSAASCGYKGSRKSTPHAAQVAAEKVALFVIENFFMRYITVKVKGPGSGRESALRALVSIPDKVENKKFDISSESSYNKKLKRKSGDGHKLAFAGYRGKKIPSLKLLAIYDVTGNPHNGCRDSKKRRV